MNKDSKSQKDDPKLEKLIAARKRLFDRAKDLTLEQMEAQRRLDAVNGRLRMALKAHKYCDRKIALMKLNAFMINTARGELLNEKALYEALKKGKLAGAGLDVFEKEPPYDSPLLTLNNVIVSPHVAAVAKDALKRVSLWVAEDTVRVLNGEKPLHPVNRQVGKK